MWSSVQRPVIASLSRLQRRAQLTDVAGDDGVRVRSIPLAARYVADPVNDSLCADPMAWELRTQEDDLIVSVVVTHAPSPDVAASTRRTRSAAVGTSSVGPILSLHGHQNQSAWASTVSASIGICGLRTASHGSPPSGAINCASRP